MTTYCGKTRLRASWLIAVLAAAAIVLLVPASALANPPSNDNFTSAQPLTNDPVNFPDGSPSGQVTGTNVDATFELGETETWPGRQYTVWFRWTAPSATQEIFDTLGSNIGGSAVLDTVLNVYTGPRVDNLTPVAHNDDCPGRNNNSQLLESCLAFTPTAGTTYYFQVDDRSSDRGNIVVNWRAAPPAPHIALPADVLTTSTPTFTFTDSGATDFVCSLDGATSGAFYAPNCSSPYTTPSLDDGGHTLSVQTKDTTTGIPGAPQVIGFTISTTPPTPPPLPPVIDPSGAPMSSSSPTFAFSDSDPTATFLCSMDGVPFTACSSSQQFPGLVDGQHRILVEAVNAGGTSSSVPYTWTIDTTPPVAPTIGSKPASLSNSASASFSYADVEAGVSFVCSLDGGLYGPCPAAGYSGLSDRPHTFAVKAQDGAGNLSAATPYTWTVDTTPPPPPTVVSGPANPTTSTSASFTLSDSEASATLTCMLDAGLAAPCPGGATFSSLSVGQHTLTVYATDAAGNRSSGKVFSWTVNAVAPPPTSSCDLGEVHGHFEVPNNNNNNNNGNGGKDGKDSGKGDQQKTTKIDFEVDCDNKDKSPTLYIHHGSFNFDGQGRQIDDKTTEDGKFKDITSLKFTSSSDAVISGTYAGQKFTATLHDGSAGNKMDTLRLQWGAYDSGVLQQKHGDVKVDQGK
jgi:hypothetical protein